MSYDSKYKLRHKPPRIDRLLRWKHPPPRMAGDPVWWRQPGKDPWQSRCEAIYAHMMRLQRGEPAPVDRCSMRGLWMWSW